VAVEGGRVRRDPSAGAPGAEFLLGAGTSAHQVEGGNRDSDWWAWEEQGRTRERSGSACDHWRRFEDDFVLARRLGHDAHRFSVEWARIEPRPDRIDCAALAHYVEIVDALHDLALEPFVTLHHFTSPSWLAKLGSWEADGVAERFARYARTVADALAPRVRWWITINEPMVLAYRAYVEGAWPPGRRELSAGFAAIRNLARAHALAYAAIHQVYRERGLAPPRVGIAKHVRVFAPCRRAHALDRAAAHLRDRVFNVMFVRALATGRLSWPGLVKVRLPAAGTLDFLGLNYYTRDFIRFGGVTGARLFGDLCTEHEHAGTGPPNALGWETHPDGLSKFLRRFGRLGVPLVVTENGTWMHDDADRAAFIDDHLEAVVRARAGGVDVRGYLYWSLLDNYEWDLGFEPRFGIVEVDYATQERHPRQSAEALRSWIERLHAQGDRAR
jgi:beta-glucosidase